jgi:hypothetical protein
MKMIYAKSMLLGLMVLGYGTSVGMLQLRNNKPQVKMAQVAEVAQGYRWVMENKKRDILLLKSTHDAYLSIPRDNFFTCLPKELRLQCCPEGDDFTRKGFKPGFDNQNIKNFRWRLKLEDRISLSSTCKPLRDTLWLDDPSLRYYIQEVNAKPSQIAAVKVSYERGAAAETGLVASYIPERPNAKYETCIIS